MKPNRETIERIEEFAQVISESLGEAFSPEENPRGFRRFINISNSAVAGEDDEVGWVFLEGKAGQLYITALDSIESDPAFGNLARADLEAELDDLARDLAVNQERAKTSEELHKRITSFLCRLARPLEKYEVAFNVEGVEFGSVPLTIGDVTFQECSTELAKDLGIKETPGESWGFFDKLVGQSVGIVTVNAGSDRKAEELAAGVFDRALNILRVCIVSSNPFAISDNQLLQRRGEYHALRKVKQQTRLVSSGAAIGFLPIDLGLTGKSTALTKDFIEQLDPLYDGTVQVKLRDALLRSLEWIGVSITRENYDHKIVDLCTALEAVLTTVSDGKKGEAVAFRMMLLSMAIEAPFPYPRDVYRLYELRSRVVHGAALGVCGESDYIYLRRIAEKAVLDTITFIGGIQEEVNQPSQLIKLLESCERMEKAINKLGEWEDKDTRAVTKYAKERLA